MKKETLLRIMPTIVMFALYLLLSYLMFNFVGVFLSDFGNEYQWGIRFVPYYSMVASVALCFFTVYQYAHADSIQRERKRLLGLGIATCVASGIGVILGLVMICTGDNLLGNNGPTFFFPWDNLLIMALALAFAINFVLRLRKMPQDRGRYVSALFARGQQISMNVAVVIVVLFSSFFMGVLLRFFKLADFSRDFFWTLPVWIWMSLSPAYFFIYELIGRKLTSTRHKLLFAAILCAFSVTMHLTVTVILEVNPDTVIVSMENCFPADFMGSLPVAKWLMVAFGYLPPFVSAINLLIKYGKEKKAEQKPQ